MNKPQLSTVIDQPLDLKDGLSVDEVAVELKRASISLRDRFKHDELMTGFVVASITIAGIKGEDGTTRPTLRLVCVPKSADDE